MHGKPSPKLAVLEELIAEMKKKEMGRFKKAPAVAVVEQHDEVEPPAEAMGEKPADEMDEDDKARLLEMYSKLKG